MASCPPAPSAPDWQALAALLLPQFGVVPTTLTPLKLGAPLVLRATAGARQWVLRIQAASRMPPAYVEDELRWLTLLAPSGATPRPQPTLAGTLLAQAEAGTTLWLGVLLEWLPGEPLLQPSPEQAAAMGRLLARVHVSIPAPSLGRWELSVQELATNSAPAQTLAPFAVARLLRQATAVLIAELAAWPEPPLPLHADTNLTNWLATANGVALLDFECCCTGPALLDLGRVAGELADPTLVATFAAGYQSLCSTQAFAPRWERTARLLSLLDVAVWALQLTPAQRAAWGAHRLPTTLQAIRTLLAD